jgi:hypothetical protein
VLDHIRNAHNQTPGHTYMRERQLPENSQVWCDYLLNCSQITCLAGQIISQPDNVFAVMPVRCYTTNPPMMSTAHRAREPVPRLGPAMATLAGRIAVSVKLCTATSTVAAPVAAPRIAY